MYSMYFDLNDLKRLKREFEKNYLGAIFYGRNKYPVFCTILIWVICSLVAKLLIDNLFIERLGFRNSITNITLGRTKRWSSGDVRA